MPTAHSPLPQAGWEPLQAPEVWEPRTRYPAMAPGGTRRAPSQRLLWGLKCNSAFRRYRRLFPRAGRTVTSRSHRKQKPVARGLKGGKEPERCGCYCLLFLTVMASEEIETCFLSFRQPEDTGPLGDGKPNLNTLGKSYFQAGVQSSTNQNSVLALEGHLLATVFGRWFPWVAPEVK